MRQTDTSPSGNMLIEERRQFSGTRINELSRRIQGIDVLSGFPELCIYVTGSYGRFEASPFSDIDLFLIHKGNKSANGASKLKTVRLEARLIDITEALGFPEFSNDGEYLAVHYFGDMIDALGGPADDFHNYFTARVLLLLESHPVYNDALYKWMIENTIDSYYRDYHDHETNFRPIFVINDIIRYWKTLCLNYEHRRNRPSDDPHQRNKNHLKNLKLKFSRVLTCFSAVILLAQNPHSTTPHDLVSIVHKNPIERLEFLAQVDPDTKQLVSDIMEQYSWFLEKMGQPREQALQWISDNTNRDDAFDRGRRFGDSIFKVLTTSAGESTLRYLVM